MCCFLPSTIKCKSVFLRKTGIDRKVKGMHMCTCTDICGYVGMWISLSYYFKLPSKFLYLWNWTFLSVSYVATTKLWCWHHNLYHIHNFYKLQLMVVLILHFEVIWYMFNSFWRAFSFFFFFFIFGRKQKQETNSMRSPLAYFSAGRQQGQRLMIRAHGKEVWETGVWRFSCSLCSFWLHSHI